MLPIENEPLLVTILKYMLLIWCNANMRVFKYFLMYCKVNGTVAFYIKQESLEIIE